MTEAEIRADEREQCRTIIERFAETYMARWDHLKGDAAKAQGWAILQAAAELQ